MKKIISLLIFLACSCAHAGWVLKNTYADIDTKDSDEILRSFSWTKDGFDALNGINLISSSKIVANEAKVKVNSYDWEDDESCTAIDPSLYKDIRITQYYYGFHYQDDITYPGMVQGGTYPRVHCKENRSARSQFLKSKSIYRK